MKQYIDKAAVVAEIEGRIEVYEKSGMNFHLRISELKNILSFINTLEVKEVDSTDAFIDKACEWLKSNLYDYAGEDDKRNIVPFDETVYEDFRKAMED